jgi:hypothetical protein
MKKLISVLLILMIVMAAYAGGRWISYKNGRGFEALKDSSLSALNAVGSYVSLAQTAQELTGKQYSRALCSVQIHASADVLEIKKCLQDESCKNVIESEVQAVAPELLGNGELRIKTFAIGEKCVP